ncbi:MAG: cytochrome c oxidase subunit II [Candidatus Omnitrophica bacterium]|nr:cytochrome c oxidase subunit II [Candidatus Omnitrophota bacterium]
MNNNYYGFGLPIDISTHGAAIDRLIIILHIFMVALFIGWGIFMIYSLIKFRARPGHKATYHLNHFKAPTYLELFVALFEAVLLVGFSFPIVNQFVNAKPDESTALKVRVVAEQFAWNVHYAGKDGIFGASKPELMKPGNPLGLDRSQEAAKDDIVAINQLHIPVHKPVIVELSSKDVIHSFFLPVMRVKQDTVPGQKIPVWFEATQTGNFEIACAQLCGLGHYRMRGFFTVDTQEDFDTWLDQMAPKPEV